MKVVIIEDEQDAVELLSSIIERYLPDLTVVGHAGHKSEIIDLLAETKPDLVFCDIQLADANAFEVLDSLDRIDFKLIFTTAYDQYALKAFDYFSVGYVLKPYAPDRIISIIDHIRSSESSAIMSDKLKDIIKSLGNESQVISLPTTEGIERLNISDILMVTADRSYSTVQTVQGRKITISKTLLHIESLIESDKFIRPHLSYLVNLDHVIRYNKADGGTLDLSDGTTVPISRRKKAEVLDQLK